MRSTLKTMTLAGVASAMLLAAPAFAQKKATGETGLVGIKLFDNAVRIVNRFGTPDDIQAIGIGGGGAIGGRGGAGAPGGFPGAPGGFGGPPGGFAPRGGPGGGGMMPGLDGAADGGFRNSDFAFGDEVLNQLVPKGGGAPGGQGSPGMPSGGSNPFGPPGAPGGYGGPPSSAFGQGRPGGMPGGPPGGFGGGFPGAGAPGGIGAPTQSQETTFTRWIYNRNGSKYGFILDKFSRVVQIEAIGLSNPEVRTSRGVKFGANFAQLIRAYAGSSPDGYEISGNSIVVRFLSKHKVAYRLNRLGQNSPHVVTGIVVAAGKG